MTPHPPDERFLRSYVQHHWVAARGGLDLFRRGARSQSDPDTRARLEVLAAEVAQDRAALDDIRRRVGAGEARVAQGVAAVGETLGRFKPSGTLVRRSPLSDLLELELMSTGVAGKRLGWIGMRALADHDPRLDAAELDRLIARADAQQAELEELRRAAAHRLVP